MSAIPSRHPILCVALLSGSFLFGCGGGSVHTTGGLVRTDPCPNADEIRLGRTCWQPEGSVWRITASAPGGEHSFEVQLLRGGRIRSADHAASSPSTDEWFVVNGELRIYLASRFVEYRAQVGNGTVFTGEASNVTGERWPFRGDRVLEPRPCAPGDMVSESGTCFTVAGTLWSLNAGGTERRIEFMGNGRVRVERAAAISENSTWEQNGDRILFFIEDQSHRFEATVAADLSSFSGPSFSATRVVRRPSGRT